MGNMKPACEFICLPKLFYKYLRMTTKLVELTDRFEKLLDAVSEPLKPLLPPIARFLLVVTFLEDTIRLMFVILLTIVRNGPTRRCFSILIVVYRYLPFTYF
jgi:hypothetical protein